MRTWILPVSLLLVLLAGGCKSKKKPSLSGEEKVELTDFMDFFPPLELPFQLGDTSLLKKPKDSLLISYKVFSQFVPDTVLGKMYGKGVKPKIYALGKATVPKAETYLFVRTESGDKKVIWALAFDRKDQFLTALLGLRPDNNRATTQLFGMDRKYTLTKTVQQKNADGSISEGRDVYALNADAKTFLLIMTDALNDKVTELINPIDTLPRKHKYAADYSNGKMNLVSVRDGRSAGKISFFIHVDKNKGECTGELKGEALFRSANTAEYRESGDPCVLKFIFSSNAVTLKEVEGCASRRGQDCVFDGSFARKKFTKPIDPKAPPKKQNRP